MKKQDIQKRVIWKMTLFVATFFVLAVAFQACQKDEMIEMTPQEEVALKSISITGEGNLIYPETYAGPVTFNPVKGKMIPQTVTIENSEYNLFENGYVLVVQNGDDSGLHTVRGANIYVNDVQVATLADFRKAPLLLWWEISDLGATDTLKVEVKGKTDGLLTIWIEGVLKQEPLDQFLIDSRDNNREYKITTIGQQTWMAENLAYLPEVYGPVENSVTEARYYVYGYEGNDVSVAKETDPYKTYGVYYNWTAAQEACPTGWHLPTADEWAALESFLIGEDHNYDGSAEGNKLAKALAARTTWDVLFDEYYYVGTPGYLPLLNNSSRFEAFGGGRKDYVSWQYLNIVGNWWTSTLSGKTGYWDDPEAFVQQINYNEVYSFRRDNGSTFNNGFNIRCVKD